MSNHDQAVEQAASMTRFRRPEVAAAIFAAGGAVLLGVAPNTLASSASMVVLVVAFSVQPALSLPVLGAVLPFHLLTRGFGSMAFSMPELVLLAALAGAAVRGVWWRGRGIRAALLRLATPFDLPIGLFVAAALLSLLASEVMRVSLRELRTLIVEPVAAFYLAVWLLQQTERLRWLLGGLLLGAVAAAGLGLYQYLFTDHVIAAEGARRILGPYSSPNQLGLYLGKTIPLALSVAVFTPRYRVAAAGALAVMLAALVLTFSVGAWLATLLAVATVVLLWRPKVLTILAGAGAAIAVASLPVLDSERVSSHLSLTRGTSFIRVQLWESSLRMIQDHPLLGVGMDNFLYHYRSGYMLPEAVAEPNLSHPHNFVLTFWLQMGIAGLAAFLWLLVTLVRMWHAVWSMDPGPFERAAMAGVAGATVDMVVHGLVDNSYFLVDMAFYFWLSMAVVAALFVSLPGLSRME